MRRTAKVLLACTVILVVSFAVDRVALYVWGYRIIHLYHSMRMEIAAKHDPSDQVAAAVFLGPDSAAEMGPVAVNLNDVSVRPDYIVSNGKSLQLFFFPPALAWTTRLFPRSSSSDPKTYYLYEIELDRGEWSGKPRVSLFHGVAHNAHDPLPDRVTHPDWFP